MSVSLTPQDLGGKYLTAADLGLQGDLTSSEDIVSGAVFGTIPAKAILFVKLLCGTARIRMDKHSLEGNPDWSSPTLDSSLSTTGRFYFPISTDSTEKFVSVRTSGGAGHFSELGMVYLGVATPGECGEIVNALNAMSSTNVGDGSGDFSLVPDA